MDALQALPLAFRQHVTTHVIPEKEAVFGTLDQPLPEALERTLASHGIRQFFSHQVHLNNALLRAKTQTLRLLPSMPYGAASTS